MEYYQTIADLTSETTNSFMALFQSIALAVPIFFPLTLFLIWVFGSASSYFIILKTTGKKRFFHTATSMSFVMFIVSLLIVSMNTSEVTIMSGYWVAFYIVATAFSWYGLTQYK
jgi:hypothetical protein